MTRGNIDFVCNDFFLRIFTHNFVTLIVLNLKHALPFFNRIIYIMPFTIHNKDNTDDMYVNTY